MFDVFRVWIDVGYIKRKCDYLFVHRYFGFYVVIRLHVGLVK
jgi:hypothetical protein